ncbi:MAG TPA: glycosyltransferase [Anaerolineae bacterium]|nr:glycosyltransferase [Anaerolineae bacterium]
MRSTYHVLNLDKKAVFVVWGPPSVGPRSQVLARELGVSRLYYIHPNTPRGLASALYRYAWQARATWRILREQRPPLVFVQSPPTLAVLSVLAYTRTAHARYIVDAHSAAFLHWFWRSPGWLFRRLARNAITTLVTNSHFASQIQAAGGNALVLRDIPTTFEQTPHSFDGAFNIVVVNTFAPDEPLSEILDAARDLPDIQFYVTGKRKSAPAALLSRAAPNVHFTDFLPDKEYYGMLAACDAVMCLTTRDHTMQRGACEALTLGKPIITSDSELLRDYFRQGTVHVANTRAAIRQGIERMRAEHARYRAEIVALQQEQQHEWEEKRGKLLKQIQQALTMSGGYNSLAERDAHVKESL